MSSRQNRIKAGLVGTATAILMGLMVFGTGASGADFSATDNIAAKTQTATLTVELGSPADGYVADLKLQFNNLAPGKHVDQVIWVKNTGSIRLA